MTTFYIVKASVWQLEILSRRGHRLKCLLRLRVFGSYQRPDFSRRLNAVANTHCISIRSQLFLSTQISHSVAWSLSRLVGASRGCLR